MALTRHLILVSARLKSAHDLALASGWQAERFRREGKSMKPLADYLDPPSPQERSDAGAQRALAVFQRFAAKQEGRADGI